MGEFFDNIGAWFAELYTMPLGSMEPWRFILMILITIVGGILSFFILKAALKFLKHVVIFVANIFSAKTRCKKVMCPHCGRTLDRCVCDLNKHRSYVSRLYHYKKEKKETNSKEETK